MRFMNISLLTSAHIIETPLLMTQHHFMANRPDSANQYPHMLYKPQVACCIFHRLGEPGNCQIQKWTQGFVYTLPLSRCNCLGFSLQLGHKPELSRIYSASFQSPAPCQQTLCEYDLVTCPNLGTNTECTRDLCSGVVLSSLSLIFLWCTKPHVTLGTFKMVLAERSPFSKLLLCFLLEWCQNLKSPLWGLTLS